MDQVVNETTDAEFLRALAEEAPTYLRSKGAAVEDAQSHQPAITARLAGLAGEPAASAHLDAAEGAVHHAGL